MCSTQAPLPHAAPPWKGSTSGRLGRKTGESAAPVRPTGERTQRGHVQCDNNPYRSNDVPGDRPGGRLAGLFPLLCTQSCQQLKSLLRGAGRLIHLPRGWARWAAAPFSWLAFPHMRTGRQEGGRGEVARDSRAGRRLGPTARAHHAGLAARLRRGELGGEEGRRFPQRRREPHLAETLSRGALSGAGGE